MPRFPNSPLRVVIATLLVLVIVIAAPSVASAQKDDEDLLQPGKFRSKELELVQYLQHDTLRNVCDVDVSQDGKHLYSAAFPVAAILHFTIDETTRELRYIDSIINPQLQGTTDIKLFPDGKHAVAVACHAKTLTLFDRDLKTGKLTVADVMSAGDDGTPGLRWPVEVTISPDGKFIYVADSRAPTAAQGGNNGGGAITMAQLTSEGKLNWIDSTAGPDNCFSGARGVLCNPNGQFFYATSHKANTLIVCERDPEVGLITHAQTFRQGVDGINCLTGAMICTLSPDRRNLYTNAGNFEQVGAVGVFGISSTGNVEFLQQFVDGENGFENFKGGNKVIVSPDGTRVYASATASGSLAVFERDTTTTGKLKLIEMLVTGQKSVRLPGANGMAFDSSGNYLYLACELGKGIAVLKIRR